MSNCVTYCTFPCVAGTMEFPVSNGVMALGALVTSSRQSLPTDPVGTINATFSGVPAGSEIRVYRADGVELAGVESAATDNPSLTWSVYAAGANSVNRIVIINLARKIVEFDFTPSVGNTSIPIQMDADRWFSNPA